ncbi:MAG: succinyl-diaminopimelate desuccinylase [Caldanaerobacter sp.]|uniref:dipeptidase PepV n=1 Tax=Caldanaerobacter sp. TaxID=2930036 RepID=UPI0024AC0D29|nr:dipeptidase PepV [Caldanaerobacter sp.]MDI3519650.1 succinyl-diaminopimelate desuccinylase [Caldanaerobacter sp.]
MDLNSYIDSMRDEIIKSVQELVRIKSVQDEPKPGMPYGEGVARALEKALEIAERLGFKTKNLDGYIGYAEYGEGEEMIAVLGHLDVVPEGDGWTYPPYGAEMHDGKIYGRGTVDDKGPIIAALYGLKAIKDAGLKLSKRVRIIFGTNEETGSHEIKYYLEHDEAPTMGFTPDAQYPIIHAEKGITMFNVVKDFNKKPSRIVVKYIKGGERPNVVPGYCEARLKVEEENTKKEILNELEAFVRETGYDLKFEEKEGDLVIKSFGIPAHGSLPHLGKNAIMQLFLFLDRINLDESDVKDFIHFFATNVGMETNGKTFGIYLKDETGELTFNVGTVSIDEDKGVLGLNIRYPVKHKYEDWMNIFEEKIKGQGMRIEDMLHQPPLYFPPDHPLIKILSKVYEEQTGQKAELLAIGGGTYAKEMPNTVAFGPVFPGKPELAHQADEYIEIEDLILNAKIYAHAIYELAK